MSKTDYDPRLVMARVLAKMALADGDVAAQEWDHLVAWLDEEVENFSRDLFLEEVSGTTLEQLVRHVKSYEDKFFIALRAYALANIDFEFHAREEALFRRLCRIFQIEEKDLGLIHEVVLHGDLPPGQDRKRLEILYLGSSFAED